MANSSSDACIYYVQTLLSDITFIQVSSLIWFSEGGLIFYLVQTNHLSIGIYHSKICI